MRKLLNRLFPQLAPESTLMAAASKPQCRKGFTLLEVVISLTILALILVVLFASLHTSIRAWEKGEKEAERYQEIRTILEIIPQQIRSSYPYVFREGEVEIPAFRGEHDSIRFISTLGVVSKDVGGLVFVSYFLDKDGLRLCEKSIYKKEMFQSEWDVKKDSLPVSSAISDLSFEYEAEDGKWSREWDVKEMLTFPRRIKIAFSYKEPVSGKQSTETLTVPLLTNTVPLLTNSPS